MLNPVLDRFIDRLTDNFDKSPNGNVHRMAQLAVEALQEQEDVLTRMDAWHDVDQAEGVTLDMHGKDVQQDRGQSSDEVYRVLIKSKVLRLLSDGSIDTIIEFLAFILDVPESEIRVRELWGRPNLWTGPRSADVRPAVFSLGSDVSKDSKYKLSFKARAIGVGAKLRVTDNKTHGGGSFIDVTYPLTEEFRSFEISISPPNNDILYISCLVGDIQVKDVELYPAGMENQPPAELGKTATLDITAPAGPINRTGLTVRQFGTLINLVIAGGVRAEANFEGTFRFSNQAGVVESTENGFAPVDQSSGGTLGGVYNPDTDYELPI